MIQSYLKVSSGGNMGNMKRKTVIDYFSLPEGCRVELIDGTFYEVPVQGVLHQDIASYLHVVIGSKTATVDYFFVFSF